MSNLILDSLVIYGLYETPTTINVYNKQFKPIIRPQTDIIEIKGLRLSMNQNHTITWPIAENTTIKTPDFVYSDPKYRVDCFPDPSE
jgi:hypothetical protein